MGSLGGGGRYDNLTGSFGMPDIPGVGISFGAERIYDVMESLQLFPESVVSLLKVLVIGLDDQAITLATSVTNQLRSNAIPSDQYPEVVKMNKSMKYANDLKVPFVIIIGQEEMLTRSYTLKNMITGSQEKLTLDQIIAKIKQS